MHPFLFQAIIPFFLSALVVIIIMYIAERFGTKTGGILGTLPSTIIVAYVFIALNKGLEFASNSVAVVPAEIGINLLFLLIFSILISRSIYLSFAVSFTVWATLSFILLYTNMQNIYISVSIFSISIIISFLILEKTIKIKSIGKKAIHYTITKIILRGLFAGTIIAITVLLSNIGEVISGIISVFPAIITSTMIISYYEHGPEFASGLAKSMVIGSSSVMSYAVAIHFLYPIYGIVLGSIAAFVLSFIVAMINLKLRTKIA